MKTVLLVGHGSRVAEGNEELRKFTSELAARKPELTFVTCFIELASPSIAEGIALCVKGGASTVYVVPIILFAAGHSKLDIPLAMDQAKLKYPGVEFVYGRPVGVQERAVDILLDRIAEATAWRQPAQPEDKILTLGENAKEAGPGEVHSVSGAGNTGTAAVEMKTSKVEDKDTIILVMGRGGSDPDANSDFYKLTRLLWERTAYKSVEGCFIAIAKPSLPEGLERCLVLGARKIVVLPYLLFTGVLMKQFSDIISQFAAGHPEVEVEQGSYLGSHPLLSDMLAERIEETLEGQSFANCDNCKYRVEAAAHHHHHHHGEEEHEHEEGHGHDHHHGEDHSHDHGYHHHHGEDHSHDHRYHHHHGEDHNHEHGHHHHHHGKHHSQEHGRCGHNHAAHGHQCCSRQHEQEHHSEMGTEGKIQPRQRELSVQTVSSANGPKEF
ncbi:sirohydrochlorin chelatase [Paenibacillus sp. FSL H7-0357]|uniref:sirohydrochlorin chelatase n=1 Tax=Paenibacillus sp. FSL H7-0357 TaxID=1536774 RepID=UPI0007C7BD6E|nr:sirohydrochlorin chelatase [Paenibacillus sp. FSL H7-0357]